MDDYAPKLAIAVPDPIGRLYRRPDSPAPGVTASGNLSLPHRREIYRLIAEGIWVPSITNVIGTRSLPYLQQWAAKLAVQEAIDIEAKWPGYLNKKKWQAIRYLKTAADRNRDQAALQGSIVHDLLERIALGEDVDVPGEYQRFVDSWNRWCDDFQPEFLHMEATVFGTDDNGNGYAGTADFIARINGMTVAGDYKTNRSGLHSEVALQLSAIAHAQEMVVDDSLVPNVEVEGGMAVHVTREGYEARPVQLEGMSWEAFQGFRSAWTYHVFDGVQFENGGVLCDPIVFPGQMGEHRRPMNADL